MKEKGKIMKHIIEERRYHDQNSAIICETSKMDLIWHVPEKMIFIDKYISKKNSWTLVDLGCGTAENIRRNLLSRIKETDTYIGVDISQKLLSIARKNVPQGKFLNLPMSNVVFPVNSVDYVTFFGSLHHDAEPKKTLTKTYSFLKKGGYIFLREPQDNAVKKGKGASPNEAGLNPILLRRWLNELNFKIIEWHFLNTRPFHLIRRILIKLRLKYWERVPLFWMIKVKLELFFEKILVFFPNQIGSDMFIVAKKI